MWGGLRLRRGGCPQRFFGGKTVATISPEEKPQPLASQSRPQGASIWERPACGARTWGSANQTMPESLSPIRN
jgi:hypothetical protein